MLESRGPFGNSPDHTGVSGHPLPRDRRNFAPVSVEHGDRCEQRKKAVAPVVVVGKGEEPDQRTTEHRIGQCPDRHAVVGDVGKVEVVVQQTCVRLVVGEDDGHPFERYSVAHRVDDAAHDDANLVVRIGDRAHRGSGRGLDVDVGWDCAAEPFDARHHDRVGLGRAGKSDDHREVLSRGHAAQQARAGCRHALRKMAYDGAELVEKWGAGNDELVGGAHQIVFVVPGRGEMLLDEPMNANDLSGAGALICEHAERHIVEVGKFAMRTDERFFGRRVRRDASEHRTGIGGEDVTDRRRDHRCRHGPTTVGCETRRGEQFGETVDGEERDADESRPCVRDRSELTRSEQPARRDPDGVAGHDDRDRRERRRVFRPRDLDAQCLRGRAAIRGGNYANGHTGIVRLT